jgi:fibronectin-binding autotransporter adhesin
MKMKTIAQLTAAMKTIIGLALLTLITSTAQAVTYTWDPSNVTGTPTPTLDWFTGGANPLGLWTGPVVPASASDTTIRFFVDTSTSLPNTAVPSTQTANLNNGGSAFQLGTLTLNGFGSATSGASLTMTLQGDALNFSGATGTISFNSVKNVAPATDPVINYTINNNIQLGTASSASALTLTGNGDNSGSTTYNIVGTISELQTGGGSLIKSGISAVTISGSINITDAVTVGAGTLTLANNTINASTMTVNGGTLILTGNLNPVSGSMTVNTGGILQIGNNTATQFGPSGNYSGNISTGTGGTLQLRSTSSQELSGIISGSGGINKGRAGNLTLSGANTYTGKSQFQPLSNGAGFQVNVSSFDYVTSGTWANHGLGSSLGAPTTVANGTIDIGGVAQAGVTLNYTGSGETTDRVLAVAWNGNSSQTIQTSGGGLLSFTSPFTLSPSGGTGTLTLGGTGNGQVAGMTGQLNTTGLSKAGAGTWTLSGPSNFTQPTKITAGILILSSTTALQNSPFDTTSVLGDAGNGLKIATTTLTLGGLTGANALRGRFTTALGGPSSATAQGGYDGLTNLTLNTVAGSTSTYTGTIIDGATGMTLTKTGAGTQILSGQNTYSGATLINDGILNAGVAQTGTTSGPLGANGNINFGGGTLQFSAATASWDPSPRIAAGTSASAVRIDVNGQAVTFGTDLTTAQSGGLTLSSATGGGSLTLTAVSTYTNPMTVNGGTLAVNGSLASGSAVIVNNGGTLGGSGTVNGTSTVNPGGTLAGTGTFNGAVTAAAGGFISPAGSGTAGTLTVANSSASALTLNGSALLFDVLSNDGSSRDQMAITGNLVLNGATTLFINAPAGIAAGSYTLITFAAATGSGSVVFPNGLTTMGNLTVAVNATDVTLTVGVGGVNVDIWSGAASYVWDGGAQNWTKNGTVSQAFADGDAVTFDDTGLAVNPITAGSTVAPSSVVFNNSSKTYTVSATIGGASTPLVKSGNGVLILSTPSTANSYGGGTTINAGTLQGTTTSTSLTPPNPLSTGTITLNGSGTILQLRASGTLNTTAETIQFNNNVTVGGNATINIDRPGATSTTKTIQLGTLSIGANTLGVTGGNSYALRFNEATTLTGNATFNNTQNLTLAGAVGGSGYSLTKSGAGTLTLSGNNTFSGGTTLNGGTLVVNSDAALGAAGTGITVSGNTTLSSAATASTEYNRAISLGAGTTLTLTHGGANTATFSGPITGSGNLTATLGSSGSTIALTNTNNTFTGDVLATVSGNGTLRFSFNSIGDSGMLSLGKNSYSVYLQYTGSSGLVLNTRRIDLNSSFGNVNDGGGNPISMFENNGAGTITFNAGMTVAAGKTGTFFFGGTNTDDNTYAGVIPNSTGGTLSIGKHGAGKWILSNNNTFAGGVEVRGGTLVLSGANTYNGVTEIKGGTLEITSVDVVANANPLGKSSAAAANLLLGNGTTLRYTGGTASTDRSFTINGTANGNAATLDASGNGAINFTSSSSPAYGTTAQTRTLILSGNNTGANTLAASIGNNGGSAVSLTKNGSGTWVLSGTSAYSGATAVNGGTLVAGVNAPSGSDGAFGNAISEVTLGVAGGNNDSAILIGGAYTVARIIRIPTSNTTDAGTRVLTLGGNTAHNSVFSGAIHLGTASQAGRGITLTAAAGGQVTFSGVIQDPTSMDSTTYTVTKAGAGTVVFSNVNTYTGTTTINEGTLALGVANALPNTAVLIGAGILDAATFTDTSIGTLDVTGAATISLGTGGTLAFANSSAIDWTGGTLNITGTLGANSIRFGSGSTALTSGQLAVISVNGSGAGTYILDANGYLVSGATPTITLGGSLIAVDTTYGSPSGSPTSFTVSGSDLTPASGNLTVEALSGYEYSATSGGTYSSTLTIPYTGGALSSSNVYVRLAATATVAGSPYSGNITVSGGGATSQNIATTSSSVSVAALTITANNQSKPYGTTQSTPVSGSTNFTSTALQNGETIGSVTLTYAAGGLAATDATGLTSTITPSAATGGTFNAGNYSITYNPGTLTVTKATLTVTADNKSRYTGEANPPLTYTITGYQNGENSGVVSGTPNLSTTADINSPVGAYTITCTTNDLSATNYDFTPVNGTLTVNPRGTLIRFVSE